jgi:hypothetical protein
MRHRIINRREKEVRAWPLIAVADIEPPSPRRSLAVDHEFPGDKLGVPPRSRVVGQVGPVPIKDCPVSGF